VEEKSIGGNTLMTWVVTAIVVSGGIQAYGQYQQGKIEEAMYEKEANEAELEASFTELQRREEINRRLAADAVGMAGSGISGEGTPASIALEQAKDVGISEGAETLSERLKAAQLRRRGKAAAGAGKIASASTLLQTGTSAVIADKKYNT
jgi:hypothetical protein